MPKTVENLLVALMDAFTGGRLSVSAVLVPA